MQLPTPTPLLLTLLIALTTPSLSLALALPQAPAPAPAPASIASLVPSFGVTPGTSPDGNGSCSTPFSPTAKIPCKCPPPRAQYISQLTAAVEAGNTFGLPAPFPRGGDNGSKIVRLQTMLSVLQNIDGQKGKGCPAIATGFKKELDALTGAGAGAAPAPNAG